MTSRRGTVGARNPDIATILAQSARSLTKRKASHSRRRAADHDEEGARGPIGPSPMRAKGAEATTRIAMGMASAMPISLG